MARALGIAAGTRPAVQVLDGTLRSVRPSAGEGLVRASGRFWLHVEPAALVEGRVVAANGQPAAGAQVNLVDEEGDWLSGLVTADLNGRFRFPGVAPTDAPAWVEVRATLGGGKRHGKGSVAIGALLGGETVTGVELELEPTGALAGAFLSGGRPIAGARIELLDSDGTSVTAATDRRGAFRVVGLPPGDYHIRAKTGTDLGRTIGDWGTFTVEAGVTTELGELGPN